MEIQSKAAAKIKITGIHRVFDGKNYGSPEETCEEYYGTISKRGSGIYIIYEAKEADGVTISNMLKYNTSSGELKRTSTLKKGTITSPSSILIYEKGQKRGGFYTTPYGRLDADVSTTELVITDTVMNFFCSVTGCMEINNSPVSAFELKIEAVYV